MTGKFVDNRDLKLGKIAGTPKVGELVTITYERGRGEDRELVTAQYPVAFVVAQKEGASLCVLGPKVQDSSTARW